MSADDAVRIANLLGSIVLFVGALRSQRWTKKQAATVEDAAASSTVALSGPPVIEGEPTSSAAEPQPKPARAGRPVLAKPGKFEADAARIGSQPYFDRPAYWLFCVGFAITTIASSIDLYSHRTLAHAFGASETESCPCAPSAAPAQDAERSTH